LRGAAFDDIEEPVAVQIDEPGDQRRRVLDGARQKRVLIDRQGGWSSEADRWSTRGRP